MKHLTVLMAGVLLCACSSKQTCRISGDVDNASGMVYLFDAQRNVIDSTALADRCFEFAHDVVFPANVYVANGPDLKNAEVSVAVFAEAGEIRIKSDGDEWYAAGTPSNDAKRRLSEKLDSLLEIYYSDSIDNATRERIDAEYDAANRSALDDNLDNLFGLSLFNEVSYGLDGEQSVELLNSFSDGMKVTDRWKTLMELAQKKLAVSVGKPYIDFVQKNTEGNDVSLESVVEKEGNRYVLLDFWASWCGPCMGEVPFLCEAYETYRDKGFEIFGSSLDRNGADWTGAIQKHSMNWIHVSDLQYWDNAAAAMYAVRSIPANFLIDCATGTIVAVNLRGNVLMEKLSELL